MGGRPAACRVAGTNVCTPRDDDSLAHVRKNAHSWARVAVGADDDCSLDQTSRAAVRGPRLAGNLKLPEEKWSRQSDLN
jgi:hypothetical protein